MNLICIGKLVNTHGIKGEVRIKSNFSYKKDVFKKGFNLIIKDSTYKINTYRVHKEFDMVTLDGINNINDILFLKGELVYVNRNELVIDGYLKEDLIGFGVYEGTKKIGCVTDLIGGKQELLEIDNKHLIPYIDEFIKQVDVTNKKIEVKLIEGLIYED